MWAECAHHPDYPFKSWLPYNFEKIKASGATTKATD